MMNNNIPIIIGETNLSYAWADLLLRILKGSGKEAHTILLSLSDFKDSEALEDKSIREALDICLSSINKQTVHTVANTIFPENLWRLSGNNRGKFFEMYIRNFPRIKALCQSKNNRGTYFKRLIDFGYDTLHNNQLEHIISAYSDNPKFRRSMFQASIFDPARDHIRSAQIGFPCLQHLQFLPNNQNRTLTVNAFYATQQVLEKAYGNYLGICRLSHFMAHEMNLLLDRVNFFIGVAKLDKIPKSHKSLVNLKEVVQEARNSSISAQIGGE